jgi:hypothetical protein
MRLAQFVALFGSISLAGCVFNGWHEESYLDQRAYQFNDAGALRDDLGQTMMFLPTIGLKQLDTGKSDTPATEAVFVRGMGDHFHVTVTVRGLADVNDPGWTMTVRVVSYNVGEEGAITTGQSLLKEIDDWHQRGRNSGAPTSRALSDSIH